MKPRPRPLCIHGRQGCPKCAAFSRSLIVSVEARDTAWRPGILAALNARSQAAQ